MTAPKALSPDQLYNRFDPARFSFATTKELKPLDTFVGQDRAVAAVSFAIGMEREGYNLFAYGPEGTGKTELVMQFLEKEAARHPVPSDWVYVYNFAEPHRPRALKLPPTQGRELAEGMEKLVDELRSAIPAAFESDEYRARRQNIEDEFKERGESAIEGLQKEAAGQNVAIVRTPMGLAVAPMKDGEIMKPDAFQALAEDEQAKYNEAQEAIQKKLQAALQDMPSLEREHREKVRALGREVTEYVVASLIGGLHQKYAENLTVSGYLKEVHKDIVENASDFLPQQSEQAPQQQAIQIMLGAGGGQAEAMQDALRRYQINVVVDNCGRMSPDKYGAPVVAEDLPTLARLVGRVEHLPRFGALVTDFMMIKAGALHEANGGYLVIDARKLLMQPYGWEGLKRALSTHSIRIENPYEMSGFMATTSLEPEPIPLELKVVLLGEPDIYYMLNRGDPEFRKLFKVQADFETAVERDDTSALSYARLAASLTEKEGLLPMTRSAVARIVEYGGRLTEDSEKISTHMGSIADLMREADYWARQARSESVEARHVQEAIDQQIHRSDRVHERMQEQIERNIIIINTEGTRVGEVNGLAVYSLDQFSFGKPSRISARVYPGRGGVIDIEREVALGGSLHTKGVMILSGYLAGKYAKDAPLSISANIAFEQSYGGVDGDSASSTELYALISAISNIALKQSIAVTGSVDQNGRVQAIGGVNEKIEGFYDLCKARGLTGEQGVMIPAANVVHLMLRADVVEACREGKFAIYPVKTIDEGLEILTGLAAGELDEHGDYPIGTVNRAVIARLAQTQRAAIRMARASAPPPRGNDGKKK